MGLRYRIQFIVFVWCAIFATAPSLVLGQDDELLEPEKAFAVSVQALDSERVRVSWRIAEGYYMYRDKFRFTVADGDASLAPAEFSPAIRKNDEFFGAVEIYKHDVDIIVPVRRVQGGTSALALDLTGQGCNEPIGVCYPPITHRVNVKLAAAIPPAAPAAATAQSERPAVRSLKDLKSLLGNVAEPEFLSPDEAFKLDLQVQDGKTLAARFSIADGYYLYRDKTRFKSVTDGVAVGTVSLPPGTEKEDEYFGKVVAYYEGFDVVVPISRALADAQTAQFEVSYQGCAEKGICYPPIVKTIAVDLPGGGGSVALGPKSPTGALGDGGFWGYVVAAFWTGVLLTFTPCVLPMIPILSSVIVGQGEQISKARGGALSIAYVLGTAATYTAVGVVAGATGDQLQAYFQNVWAIGAVSLVLVVLALSMFGLFDIQMPAFVQSRLQNRTQGLRGGALGMVFVLGLGSALIVGACVSPLLILALGVAIAAGDPLLGGAIMFSMAMGMGVFLIAIGFGAAFLLPRAGAWMERVKQAFGVLLLAVAIYLLGTIPTIPVLYLWAALLIITAIYLGAMQALPDAANGWRYLAKGIGVFMLVWGVLALLGGMNGSRDILKPLVLSAGITGAPSAGPEHALFTRVVSLDELDAELKRARASGKPVLLDYYADWCVDCVRMERATFQHYEVSRVLREGFVTLQVDVTDPHDAATKAIKKRYGVFGPPAMLFFAATGEERPDLRRYGYIEATAFLAHIRPLTTVPKQVAARLRDE
ncbi:MAG: protein-disulfide reductase DsbD [Gammaproteobacteria bacterium]|nr:protein-disulfide reductase DsbD [Gammaproteobacteria bacterium]